MVIWFPTFCYTEANTSCYIKAISLNYEQVFIELIKNNF